MDAHPDSARPLPEMLGDVPPEHDLRGRLIVLMIYVCGAAACAGIAASGEDWGTRLALLIVTAPFFGAAAFIARAVQRFACWSWFFLGAWAVLLLPAAVGVLVYEDDAGTAAVVSAAAVMLSLGALHYLWVRRWDFWADARLDLRRQRPRAVTADWRAARLAGIATQPIRRRTVSPQPGALWRRSTSSVRR